MKYILTNILLFIASGLFADSWLPPKPFAYVSPNSNVIVRVEPGVLDSDRKNISTAQIRYFKYDKGSQTYRFWKEHKLVNSMLPLSIVTPDDGSFLVTFDDYMAFGTGENTVVLYDSSGKVVKRWSLEDIFSESAISELPHSTMSILWRGEVGVMRTKQNEVYILPFDSKKKLRGFILDVETLEIREDTRWK